MKILTAEEMRATDAVTASRFGVSMQVLMEHAGRAVAEFAVTYFKDAQRCTVLCGTGNNGGDGLVAARYLAQMGWQPAVLIVGDTGKLHGEAAVMLDQVQESNVPVFQLEDESGLAPFEALFAGADVLIDALVGTGFKPPLRRLAAAVRDKVNALEVSVLAVDLPSGWDADSADEKNEGAMRASAVVTFTAPKTAHVFGHLTKAVFGPVVVAPIGSPEAAIQSANGLVWAGESKRIVEKPREINSNKGRFGHVLVVGGALGKSGAPAMSSLGALRAGAGLVTAAVPKSVIGNVAAIAPELMTAALLEDDAGSLRLDALEGALHLLEKKVTVLALGPGLGTEGETPELVRALFAETKLPVVLDADALNAFAGKTELLHGKGRTVVLTPHPGEMARLLGADVKTIEADRVNIARAFAKEHQVTLLLKGWRTVIAHPDGMVAVNTSANPSMAKGGSGDILTGIVAALLAQFPDRVADAVNAAAYVHGLAADFAAHAMDEKTVLATDTVAHLSDAYRYRSTDNNGHAWLTGLRQG